jgi:hypothetical protein
VSTFQNRENEVALQRFIATLFERLKVGLAGGSGPVGEEIEAGWIKRISRGKKRWSGKTGITKAM